MNARKSMSLIGAAIVIGVGVTGQYALAGIDRGGKTEGKDRDKEKVTRGRIHRFGSVYVNGARYDTSNAAFLINGSLASETELTIGQVVTVYGTWDEETGEGAAWLIVANSAVEGPISALNTAAGTMRVLGQDVKLNTDTAWSLSSAGERTDLGAGDVVAISGYRNADGDIVATLVTDRLSDGDFDVTGAIGSVDAATTTFWIDGLSVDYGSANLFGLAGGMPTIGQRVDVSGATLTADGQLLATTVSADFDAISAGDGTAAEVEGLLTHRRAWNEFALGDTTVRFGWNTRFVDGSVFGLHDNVELEVEGRFGVDGVLYAESVRFEQSASTSARGFVEAIDEDSFVVGGRRFLVTPETAWEDDSDDGDRYFRIGAMRTGDFINVQGYPSGGAVTATRVERDEADFEDADDFDDLMNDWDVELELDEELD